MITPLIKDPGFNDIVLLFLRDSLISSTDATTQFWVNTLALYDDREHKRIRHSNYCANIEADMRQVLKGNASPYTVNVHSYCDPGKLYDYQASFVYIGAMKHDDMIEALSI
jgi:hypothetical protein